MMMLDDWAGYCEFRDAFAEVIDERYYSIEWLDQLVATGAAKFWRTEDAAIIAELREYPSGATDVHGLIAAGKLSDIIGALIPAAEQWGREKGCIAASIESREGWQKALKFYGYSPYQISVRKEL